MRTLADLVRRLNFDERRRAGAGPSLPRLILMTDVVRLPDPAPILSALPRGSAVVVRHPESAARAALARRLRPLCRRRGVRLLIAGDARLAAAVGADGLHLPEAAVRRASGPWRLWRCRRRWLVTAAAHSPAALRRARAAGADAALLSPVFATASHPGAAGLGVLRFTAWARHGGLPVYALGGIDRRSARRLQSSGAAGFAGIGGLTA